MDANDKYPPDEPVRTVRVRIPKHTHRPVIAIAADQVLMEDGTIYGLAALPWILAGAASSIIAVQDFGDALMILLESYKDHPLFQLRATPKGRDMWSDNQSCSTMINFVGFKATADKHEAARYHYPLDPLHFCRQGIDELYPDARSRIIKLLEWGKHVRAWCERNQLEVKPSCGGLAAQLLRDRRFYPEPRRKVPRIINTIARSVLPGNHYRLLAEANRPIGYNAIYLDMEAAHHSVATRLRFPDANTLYAYGNWSDTRSRTFAPGSSGILEAPGLFRLAVTIPHIPPNQFPPPTLMRPGDQDIWLYSNELDHLREFGVGVNGIIAALVSDDTETGLNKYARFAIRELRTAPKSERPWLKPTLHSAYGLLAARPVQFETGFHQSFGGNPAEYLIGRHSIHVLASKARAATETKIVNVIHRGMIEAEVRKVALDTARLLSEDGRQILAIYADSLLIRDDGRELPLMQAPWRIKDTLTDLRFIDSTHFVAKEWSRLPGVPKDRDETARIDAYWARVAHHRAARLPITLANREKKSKIHRVH